MTYDFFKNYSSVEVKTVKSIRPGTKSGDPVVTNIKELQYHSSGLISYKLDHDHDWRQLPNAYTTSRATPERLHLHPLKIKNQKYLHLQQLKSVIPEQYHSFYDNLPHEY